MRLGRVAVQSARLLEPHDRVRRAIAAYDMIEHHSIDELKQMLRDNSDREWASKPILLITIFQEVGLDELFMPADQFVEPQ